MDMIDQKFFDCFKPIPLPTPKVGQTYQPRDETWYELEFLYRVDFKVGSEADGLTADRIVLGILPEWFASTKKALQSDPARWGKYREDWFCVIDHRFYSFYFMDRTIALQFRLWVV